MTVSKIKIVNGIICGVLALIGGVSIGSWIVVLCGVIMIILSTIVLIS